MSALKKSSLRLASLLVFAVLLFGGLSLIMMPPLFIFIIVKDAIAGHPIWISYFGTVILGIWLVMFLFFPYWQVVAWWAELTWSVLPSKPRPDGPSCVACGDPATWVYKTQFSGNHHYCQRHAEAQDNFGEEDPSYFFWEKLEPEAAPAA